MNITFLTSPKEAHYCDLLLSHLDANKIGLISLDMIRYHYISYYLPIDLAGGTTVNHLRLFSETLNCTIDAEN